jgi:hypothetical protein
MMEPVRTSETLVNLYQVRFEVLTAVSTQLGTYCLHRQGDHRPDHGGSTDL